jgi:hypothetical protein
LPRDLLHLGRLEHVHLLLVEESRPEIDERLVAILKVIFEEGVFLKWLFTFLKVARAGWEAKPGPFYHSTSEVSERSERT